MSKIIMSVQERLAKISSMTKLNQTGQSINEDAACELASMIADEMDAITEIAEMVAGLEV